MKFGAVRLDQSLGGIIAHGLKVGDLVLKKGDVVLADHVAALRRIGIEDLVVARIEDGDIGEDAAAHAIAEVLAGDNLTARCPSTGRVNLHANCDGLFVADNVLIDRLNSVDERITLATVAPMRRVKQGEMVATIKIIPFAIPNLALSAAIDAVKDARLSVAAFKPQHIGVVSTMLPGLKPSVITKTLLVLENRISSTGASIVAEERVAHEPLALSRHIQMIAGKCEIVVVFGASAITDRRDVIPAAIEMCGGHIVQLGMPVDPGNLLLLARLSDGAPALGAPGCARSCKENGFDWVLDRLLAGLPVSSRDIRRMGAGGLIKENVGMPQLSAQRRRISEGRVETLRPWNVDQDAEAEVLVRSLASNARS